MSVTSTTSTQAYVAPPPPEPVQTKNLWDNPNGTSHTHGAEGDLHQDHDVAHGGVDVDAKAGPTVDAQGVIDGTGTGKRLPSGETPDGKEIRKTQLADGEQASLVREDSMGDAGNGQLYYANRQVVLTTKGSGDDQVSVSQRDDGTLDVNVNGESYEVKLAEGQEFGIRVGDGNDTVTVAPNVKVNFVIDGGADDDVLTGGAGDDRFDGGTGNDTISGHGGRDDIFGNTGNDTIDGGDGPNVLYGGDGDDSITASGQGGVNYMEGGAGTDRLTASNGQNIVSGGSGDDTLTGGGKNSIYAGEGQDTISEVTSQDLVYAQTDVDSISFAAGQRDSGQVVMNVILDPKLGMTGVKVEGSDAFRQRVEAEIEFLRSSPNGQQMLAEFDKVAQDKGHTITIKELSNEQNGYAMPDPSAGNVTWGDIQINDRTGKAGPGVDVEIRYNPSFHMDQFPAPLVVLYHEMSHAYNFANGTLLPGTYSGPGIDRGQVPNSERQAVGLDSTAKPFDFDGDPSTPATTHNPIELTENGIRRELGLPDRPAYTLEF